MTFRHPANSHEVHVRHAFLWCLMFGCFYFIKHGAWGPALIALAAAIFTFGLAWLIYPFFAKGILRKHYLRSGWIEVTGTGAAV